MSSLSNNLLLEPDNTINYTDDVEVSATSSDSDTDSEISLSEKIILESNEKRLRSRMDTLQKSILNLKQQLKLEKELWKEDIEKIYALQKQQQEMHTCSLNPSSSSLTLKTEDKNSISSLSASECPRHVSRQMREPVRTCSIKQLLEIQNYKRKLFEIESMCNNELFGVKKSLEDLRTLQTIVSEWGNETSENQTENSVYGNEKIQEIFVAGGK